MKRYNVRFVDAAGIPYVVTPYANSETEARETVIDIYPGGDEYEVTDHATL